MSPATTTTRKNSHVIPALIRRFRGAKVANALSVHVMNLDQTIFAAHTQPMQSHINVGYGQDITIAEVAQAVSQAVGYEGRIALDPSKPDGAPRKLMDSSRLNALGWQAKTRLEEGLKRAYQDFIASSLRA